MGQEARENSIACERISRCATFFGTVDLEIFRLESMGIGPGKGRNKSLFLEGPRFRFATVQGHRENSLDATRHRSVDEGSRRLQNPGVYRFTRNRASGRAASI